MADNQFIVDIKVEAKEINEAERSFDRLTDSIEVLGKVVANAKKNNKQYKKVIEELDKALDAGTISAESHRQQTKLLNAEIKKNNIHVAKSSVELSKQKRERTANIKLINSEKGSYDRLNTRLAILRKTAKDLGVQFGTNSKQFKTAAAQVGKLDSKLKLIDNELGNNQRSVGKYSNALKGLGKQLIGSLGLVGGVSALVGIMKNAFKIFTDFSKASSGLAAILKLTKSEIGVLTGQAKKLGSTTAFTASEVIKLQTELARLGFEINDIRNATPAILDLAAALNINLADAAQVSGGIVRAFGLSTKDTKEVVDSMVATLNNSGAAFGDYREAVKLSAPIFKAANIDFKTMNLLIGNLADSQIKGSLAGTGLKNLVSKLADENSKLSKELGFTVRNSDDLVKAFELLKTKNIDLTKATELTDERSKAAFLTLIQGVDSTDKLSVALNNLTDNAKVTADTMLNNLAGDTTKAQSAWEGFVLSMADGEGVISKAMRGTVQGFTNFLGQLTLFNEVGIVKKLKLIANAALSLFEKAFLPLIGVLEALGVEVPKFRFQVEKTTGALRLQNDVQFNSVRLTKEQKDALKESSDAQETATEKTKRLAEAKKKAAEEEKKAERQRLEDAKRFEVAQNKLIELDNKRRLSGIENAKKLRDARIAIEMETRVRSLLNEELLGIEKEAIIAQSVENIIKINEDFNEQQEEEKEEKLERLEAANETIRELDEELMLSQIENAEELKNKLIELEKAKLILLTDDKSLFDEEKEALTRESGKRIENIERAFAEKKKADEAQDLADKIELTRQALNNITMIATNFVGEQSSLFGALAQNIVNAYETGKVTAENAVDSLLIVSNSVFNAISERRAKDLDENEKARQRQLELATGIAFSEVNILQAQLDAQEIAELEAKAKEGDLNAKFRLSQIEAEKVNTDAQSKINEEFDKKSATLKLKQFKADKAQTLIEITIATALAVIKAAAAFPIPPFPFAITVGVLGGIQFGIAAAQKPPTFAKGTNDIVNIGGSHSSGNDTDVWGFSGGKKQFFGKVERGEAMPVIRKSAVNDYMVAKLNGRFSDRGKRTFKDGTPDITQENQAQNNEIFIKNIVDAFSSIEIVAKIEDITRAAGKKMEIINNSKV